MSFHHLTDIRNNPKEVATFLALMGYAPTAINNTLVENDVDPNDAVEITVKAVHDALIVERVQQEIINADRSAIDQERT